MLTLSERPWNDIALSARIDTSSFRSASPSGSSISDRHGALCSCYRSPLRGTTLLSLRGLTDCPFASSSPSDPLSSIRTKVWERCHCARVPGKTSVSVHGSLHHLFVFAFSSSMVDSYGEMKKYRRLHVCDETLFCLHRSMSCRFAPSTSSARRS